MAEKIKSDFFFSNRTLQIQELTEKKKWGGIFKVQMQDMEFLKAPNLLLLREVNYIQAMRGMLLQIAGSRDNLPDKVTLEQMHMQQMNKTETDFQVGM